MRRLHPATMIVALLPKLREVMTTLLPPLLISAASGKGDRMDLYLSIIGLLGGLGAFATYFSTRFALETDRVTWKSGMLWKKDRQIPLDKIQNVSVTENVFERLLRVATVEVETAAGAGPELKLRVLAKSEAEAFRDELLLAAKLGANPTSSVEEAEVHRISRQDLVLGALSENHVGSLLLNLFGWSAGLPVLFKGQRLWLWELMFERPLFAGLIIAGLFLLVVLAGWVMGAVMYVLKYGGFSVTAGTESFRISYGLLNKVQLTVRKARVEKVVVSQSIIQRWIGRCTVNVETAGSFGEVGVTAPIALMIPYAEAEKMVAEAVPGATLSGLEWRRFPKAYYQSLWFVPLMIVLVGLVMAWGIGLAGNSGAIVVLQVSVLLLPLLSMSHVVNEYLSRKQSGYAISEHSILVRSGFFTQSTMLMPWTRVEYGNARQRPFWRRTKAWSMAVGGMARWIAIPGVTEADFDTIHSRLSEQAVLRRSAVNEKFRGKSAELSSIS